MAERCLFPASPRPRSRFSPRCCKHCFRAGPSSSSRKISRRRKVSSRIWKRGWVRRRCFIRHGKFCRTKASCRTPTSSATACKLSSRFPTIHNFKTQNSKLIVTSVTALLQKTFPPDEIAKPHAQLQRGAKIAPLDLIELLEEQGYEPEAQVSQKGEIALRGGIVDIFPPTSPWPVRLEFFGDELESLRHFDPLTQISREEISEVTIPPAGEMGIFKTEVRSPNSEACNFQRPLATLLDYLPRETIFLLCEPESLAVQADAYAQQIPKDDPFFISWPDFLVELNRRGFTSIELI